MEKERKIKVLSIVALIVAVLGLTVAFAALSQTLTINGTAKVEKNNADGTGDKWNVRFYGVSSDGTTIDESTTTVKPVITGGSSYPAKAKDATLNDTTISGVDVTLRKPGDKVVYTFYVKNAGKINAKLSTANVSFNCTSTNQTYCDNNISSSLTYENGNSITQNDTLISGESKKMILTFEFKDLSNVDQNLPSDDVVITFGNNGDDALSLVYVQSNS